MEITLKQTGFTLNIDGMSIADIASALAENVKNAAGWYCYDMDTSLYNHSKLVFAAYFTFGYGDGEELCRRYEHEIPTKFEEFEDFAYDYEEGQLKLDIADAVCDLLYEINFS